MEIFKKNPLRNLLLLGLFLNVFICLITGPILNMNNFLEILPLIITDTLLMIAVSLLALGIALIPYAILGFVWKRAENVDNKYAISGLMGALTFIVINNVFFYFFYFLDLFSDDPSSTGGLAIFAYLFYAPIVAVIGYFIGKGVYRLRNKLNKP